MRTYKPWLVGAVVAIVVSASAFAQEEEPTRILFTNVNIFDGNPLEDITVIGGTDAWFDADPEFRGLLVPVD
jgi:hypothetical protein